MCFNRLIHVKLLIVLLFSISLCGSSNNKTDDTKTGAWYKKNSNASINKIDINEYKKAIDEALNIKDLIISINEKDGTRTVFDKGVLKKDKFNPEGSFSKSITKEIFLSYAREKIIKSEDKEEFKKFLNKKLGEIPEFYNCINHLISINKLKKSIKNIQIWQLLYNKSGLISPGDTATRKKITYGLKFLRTLRKINLASSKYEYINESQFQDSFVKNINLSIFNHNKQLFNVYQYSDTNDLFMTRILMDLAGKSYGEILNDFAKKNNFKDIKNLPTNKTLQDAIDEDESINKYAKKDNDKMLFITLRYDIPVSVINGSSSVLTTISTHEKIIRHFASEKSSLYTTYKLVGEKAFVIDGLDRYNRLGVVDTGFQVDKDNNIDKNGDYGVFCDMRSCAIYIRSTDTVITAYTKEEDFSLKTNHNKLSKVIEYIIKSENQELYISILKSKLLDAQNNKRTKK